MNKINELNSFSAQSEEETDRVLSEIRNGNANMIDLMDAYDREKIVKTTVRRLIEKELAAIIWNLVIFSSSHSCVAKSRRIVWCVEIPEIQMIN